MTREEAIKILKEERWYMSRYSEEYEEAYDMAIEALKAEPIRCKECKHYIVEGITTQYGWCHEYKHSVDEDDYCPFGERREE